MEQVQNGPTPQSAVDGKAHVHVSDAPEVQGEAEVMSRGGDGDLGGGDADGGPRGLRLARDWSTARARGACKQTNGQTQLFSKLCCSYLAKALIHTTYI